VSGVQFSTADTIAAIATPPGRGGIGVVRVSGPDAHRIACALATRSEPFVPRYATLVTIRLKPDPTAGGTRTTGGGTLAPGDLSTFSTSGGAFGRGGTPTNADGTPPTDGTRASDVAAGVNGSSARGAIDQAVVTYFQAPASYTGEDVVEISAHGSPIVLTEIVVAATRHGARLAERGEFTLRAFLNGRIDLAQAEAVADLIEAATPLQARAAFDQLNGTLTQKISQIDQSLFDLIARLEASVDFPEEGYHFVAPAQLARAIDRILSSVERLLKSARHGQVIRDGFQIVIVGPPNVGKSSLFNALVGSARAIVTDVPGTTRDLITETVDFDGLRATFVDTAGVRDTADAIEFEGVSRSRSAVAVADLVLLVLDRSCPGAPEWWSGRTLTVDCPVLLVANKCDLPAAWTRPDAVDVSSMTGCGLDRLRREILVRLQLDDPQERPAITNVRHIGLVERAQAALSRALHAASTGDGVAMPEEFVLADLQEARGALEEITGRRTSDDLLAHIFERFCIGK
jgi:tRNA modification GTPase